MRGEAGVVLGQAASLRAALDMASDLDGPTVLALTQVPDERVMGM